MECDNLFQHGDHGDTESTEKGKTLNHSPQRHRDTEKNKRKTREKQRIGFDFLCVSVVRGFSRLFVVPVVLVVANSFFAFLRALRG
jgi:hypothetical protein